MFSSSADPSDVAAAPPVETAAAAATTTLPLDAAQRRWWEENRHLARHVPGQGWQVPGHAGFYTEQGARIVPAHMQVSADEIARARSTNHISAPERLLENSRSLVGQGRDEAVARKLLT
ncbi:MAG: hypothetical protein MI757_05795 [Pirellulales bacterium]|nr:hypothetical protein [Pirellulales bacterium]